MENEVRVIPRRRANDVAVSELAGRVAGLEAQLAENTKLTIENTVVTKQVYDVLATFHIIGVVAKWLTGIAVFLAAGVALVKAVWHFRDASPL